MPARHSSDPNIDTVYYRDGVYKGPGNGAARQGTDGDVRAFHARDAAERGINHSRHRRVGRRNEGANFLKKLYPHPEQITRAGLGTGDAVRRSHPHMKFVRIARNAPLPFADGSFDITCSNAVLEHVGGSAQRVAFMKEHLRVAKAVFVTFPNRWFPVEHHTSIPLLHYWPRLFRSLLKGGKFDYWTRVEQLDFLDRRAAEREWPLARKPRIMTTGLPLGPLSSNVCICFRPDA